MKYFKKLLSIILAVLLIVSVLPITASAMQISVQIEGGAKISLEVENDDEISSVKQKVYENLLIPVAQQRLFYDGQELEDGRTLQDYNCTAGVTLSLLFKGKGGKFTLVAGDKLTIDNNGYVLNNGDRVSHPGNYILSGGEANDKINAQVVIYKGYDAVFEGDGTAAKKITLNGLHLENTTASPFELQDGVGVNLVLEAGSENTLIATATNCAGLQASSASSTSTLVIGTNGSDAGKLTAVGGENSAGIGGGYQKAGGEITINGGEITATGGIKGAGIGGGTEAAGGKISITGGEITATGGSGAAGIGGGYDTNASGGGGNISISGGIITATATGGGAGIGGGNTSDGGTITVRGGTIDSTKIGAGTGSAGSSTNVQIEGGCIVTPSISPSPNRADVAKTPVLHAVINLEDVTTKTKLMGGTINGQDIKDFYGIKDVWSDDNGNFSLYLPRQDAPVAMYLNTSAGSYEGEYDLTSNWANTTDTVILDPSTTEVSLNADGQYLWIFNDGYKVTSDDTVPASAEHANICDYKLTTTGELASFVRVMPDYDAMLDPETGLAGRKIILSGLNLSSSTESPFELRGATKANIVLADGKENQLSATDTGNAALQVPDTAVLAINADSAGTGRLTATGGVNSAGIGGENGGAGGTVIINGGDVSASSRGGSGAGIGGGKDGAGGTVIINGGEVNASGGDGGAAIGGGNGGDGGTVTINGGEVEAISQKTGGAGIGSGKNGAGGTITINGGKVIAQTYESGGAGIGGGEGSTAGTITINGGEIEAKGAGEGAIGIGAGKDASGGNITVNGGTLDTSGRVGGIGVVDGTFTINGGSIKSEVSGPEVRLGGLEGGLEGPEFVAPKNSWGKNVYLSELTFSDELANKSVPSGNLGTAYTLGEKPSATVYGNKDMKTDNDSKLYLWLPEAEYGGSSIGVDTTTQTGYFKTDGEGSTAYVFPNYTVTATINKDGELWTDTEKVITLRDDYEGIECSGTLEDGVVSFLGVINGTYDVYSDETGLDIDVTVSGADDAVTIPFVSAPRLTEFVIKRRSVVTRFEGVIEESDEGNTITVEVPTGTDVTDMVTFCTKTPDAATSLISGLNDFTTSQTYGVEYDTLSPLHIAEKTEYTVTVVQKEYKEITLDPTDGKKYLYIFDDGYKLSGTALTDPTTDGTHIGWDGSYELSGGTADTPIEAFVKVMKGYNGFAGTGAVSKSIALDGLYLTNSFQLPPSPFSLEADTSNGAKVNLVLSKDSKNSFTSRSGYIAAMGVPENTTIVINDGTGEGSSGELEATASSGAGIGGSSRGDNAGNITINGGVVTAVVSMTHTGFSGASIGGNLEGSGGNITINAGVVNASSSDAAGIGGGINGDGGNITINGGIVNANGGMYGVTPGAGIGGGGFGPNGTSGNSGGNIVITGGIVNAQSGGLDSGGQGAGIGGGYLGNGGNITISGGIINAISNEGLGAGIGGGSGAGTAGAGGNITILGGTIFASGYNGVGTGRYPEGAESDSITIKGGNINAISTTSDEEGTAMTVAPTDGTSPVYLAALSLRDSDGTILADKEILAGTLGDNAIDFVSDPTQETGYGINDVRTDAADEDPSVYAGGNLFLYLPDAEYDESEISVKKSDSETQNASGYFKTDSNEANGTSYILPNYTVTATIKKDGSVWADSGKTNLKLFSTTLGSYAGALTGSAVEFEAVPVGTFNVYNGATDLGLDTTIASDALTFDVPFISEPRIASFKLAGSTGVVNHTNKTIAVSVLEGTDVSNIEPTITTNASHVTLDQDSTGRKDFSDPDNPVEYTVGSTSPLCVSTKNPMTETYTVEIVFKSRPVAPPPSDPSVTVTPNDDDTYEVNVPENTPKNTPITFKPSKGETVDEGTVLRVTAPAEMAGEFVGKSIVNADGSITFIVPDGIEFEVVNNAKRFDDVDDEWFAGNVDFTSARELFSGTTDTTFSPNDPTTRAMFAAILWRLEMRPEESGNQFDDIRATAYYAAAAQWAEKNGIIEGVGGNKFAPRRNISREELVTMMYRYAKYLGLELDESGDLSEFTDANEVSGYALPAMKWAVNAGIIEGKKGKLDPKGEAKRCEAAAILQRFVEYLLTVK